MTRWTRKSHEVVADAMRVRRWVLETLTASQCVPSSRVDVSAAAVAEIPAAVWRLVLRTECTALPVLHALTDHTAVDLAIRALIVELSFPELQRCMTAAAQLREIDRLCARHGLSPVILKGGATIARGRNLDLGDLDIYFPSREAHRFAELLDRSGYERRPGPGSAQHLDRRYAPQRLPIEIHHALMAVATDQADSRAATLPVPGYESLRVLNPADHAWHVLHHCVGQHSNRRGVLRDILSVGFAIEQCSDDEVRGLRAKAQTHRRCDQFLTTLDLALAVRAGSLDDVQIDDRLRRFNAARYALANPRFEPWLRPIPAIYIAAFIALEPNGRIWDVKDFLWPGVTRWKRASHGPLQRMAAHVAEKLARLVHHGCALSIGASIAASVSRTVRRSELELSRSA